MLDYLNTRLRVIYYAGEESGDADIQQIYNSYSYVFLYRRLSGKIQDYERFSCFQHSGKSGHHP